MHITEHKSKLQAAIMVFAMGVVCVCSAQQGDLETLELQTTLQASARRVAQLEVQLAAQKSQSGVLSKGLASANDQASRAREALEKLRGVCEGLGIGALDGNLDQVRSRLVAALGDLRLLDEQKKRLSDALVSLSECALAYTKSNSDQPSEELQNRLKASASLASGAIATALSAGSASTSKVDFYDGKVVGVKPELGIAILDVGAKDGVRIGMPFQVVRSDRRIAKVLVVDVRRSHAGVVIQEVLNTSEAVQVGDRGVIDAERGF
jgi:hypothetical protein